MSGPDDISQSAWDAAEQIRISYSMPDPSGDRETIARAIHDAVMREREGCAQLVDDWVGPETLLPMASEAHNNGAYVGMYEASERISEAIRNRTTEQS